MLLLGKNSHKTSSESLPEVVTPNATKTWMPIPHSMFLETVKTGLEARGIGIHKEEHGLSNDTKRYFGILYLEASSREIGVVVGHHGNGSLSLDTYTTVLGLRNSHDKQFSAGISYGASVTVCDNLVFTGELVLRRKHTSGILNDLPGIINEVIPEIVRLFVKQREKFDRYHSFLFHEWSQVSHTLVLAVTRDIIPGSVIPKILGSYCVDYGNTKFDKRMNVRQVTAWSLFNVFTREMGKRVPTDRLVRKTVDLCELFDEITE